MRNSSQNRPQGVGYTFPLMRANGKLVIKTKEMAGAYIHWQFLLIYGRWRQTFNMIFVILTGIAGVVGSGTWGIQGQKKSKVVSAFWLLRRREFVKMGWTGSA